MNSKERRKERRIGVQKGFGPRHAFNAQEGAEAVPEPDSFGPGWQLKRALKAAQDKVPGAAKWFLNEVRSGILSDEDIAEIKNNPTGVRALEAYANAAIMLSRGAGGKGARELPRGAVPRHIWDTMTPVKGSSESGLPVRRDAAGNHYEMHGTHSTSTPNADPFENPVMDHVIVQPVEAPGTSEAYWAKYHKEQDRDLPGLQEDFGAPKKSDEQFPSLNKPPYDALKEPGKEMGYDELLKKFKGIDLNDIPLEPPPEWTKHPKLLDEPAPGEPGSDLHYEKWLEGKKFKDESAANDAYWQDVGAADKAAKKEFLDKHTHDFEVQPDMTLKKVPPEEPPSAIDKLIKESEEGWRGDPPPKLWPKNWADLPPEQQQFFRDRWNWKSPEEFKRGTKGVRHNPKTKTGRPPKIGVEKGYGPRHAANAKEGQDLTEINTDTVPAMLTPREAVLNRNAAELAGRDDIEALNAEGNQLAQQGIDLAGKDKNMKSKPKSKSGSPYVQGFEAQKAKGYEGGVAKLPKPPESVGSLQTPGGYTNTNKWGNPYGWNPGAQPQLGGGQPGELGHPGGGTLGQPVGTQNVNQYGVAYGWNPGGASLGGGAGLGHGNVHEPYSPPGGCSPWPAQPPGGWTSGPQPLKSGGLYPPGQGIFRGATGASDVGIGDPDPQAISTGWGAPPQLSAPDLGTLVSALTKEAQKQGLSPSQIQGILGAFKGMGGGSGYANQSPSAGEDFGNPNYIGLGTPSYQGGISEVGYPPGIAPRAVFSYDEGGWTGPLDPRWSSPGYQGGTSGVPGLYQGEHDFRGGGPSTIGSGGRDFTGNPRIGPGPGFPPADESTDPADRFSGNRPFGPDLRMAWMGGGRLGYQPPPWAAGFSQGPTMIPTTLGRSGYPMAVPASSDWDKSGARARTPPPAKK